MGNTSFYKTESQMSSFPAKSVGVTNRPGGTSHVYIYNTRIYNKDEDHADMRCGCMSIFISDDAGQWWAITTRELFLRGWDPLHGRMGNPSENIMHKKVFHYELAMGAKPADVICNPTMLMNKGEIGHVVRKLVHDTVLVKVDKSFTETEAFKKEGVWAPTSGMMTLIVDDATLKVWE